MIYGWKNSVEWRIYYETKEADRKDRASLLAARRALHEQIDTRIADSLMIERMKEPDNDCHASDCP